MEGLKKFRRSVINRSFLTAAGLAVLLACLGRKDYALGILLGVLAGALNFWLLSFQILRFASSGARFRAVFSFLLRYGILALGLILVVGSRAVNVLGFLIGFFILQLHLYLSSFLSRATLPRDGGPR
jgi:hypothetical protein